MISGTNFSCIIPARDAARTLGRCLEAVFSSSLAPAEVIVVNDESRDETERVARSAPCRVLGVDLACGPMPPRLAGARVARHAVCVFVDADVRVRADTFERLIAHFSDPSVDAVTGILARSGASNSFASAFKNEYMNFIFSRQLRNADFLYGSIWAVRKPSLTSFEPSVQPFGSLVSDTELGLELARQGKRIILDHALEVEHLKEYSLTSLLANDFVIPFSFALAWAQYGRLSELARRKRFSHVSCGQVLATSAAFAALACALAAGVRGSALFLGAAVAFTFAFFAYWASFLLRLRARGAGFVISAALFLPVDAVVMFCGMLTGFVFALWRRRARPRSLHHVPGTL